jgi:hypothetical protein
MLKSVQQGIFVSEREADHLVDQAPAKKSQPVRTIISSHPINRIE